MTENCSFCTHPLSKNEETNTKIFGKPVCNSKECLDKANTELQAATDKLLSPRDKVLKYLAAHDFKEQSTKNFFLLEDGSNIGVDLREIEPKVGVCINGQLVEEGHGVLRVQDIRNDILGILKSKNTAPKKKEEGLIPHEKTKPPVLSDHELDEKIERAKARRFVEGQGDFYKVRGKERPDAAMIQKLANESGISVEITKAEQTDKYAHVEVMGIFGDLRVPAVVHHDFNTEFMLKTMEIIENNPEILDHYENTTPVIKEGAQIKQGSDFVDAKYYLVHALLSFKKFSLRDACTKAMSIVELKLLNQEFRDEDEIASEQGEKELIEKKKGVK